MCFIHKVLLCIHYQEYSTLQISPVSHYPSQFLFHLAQNLLLKM
jgi:hypothetical protein